MRAKVVTAIAAVSLCFAFSQPSNAASPADLKACGEFSLTPAALAAQLLACDRVLADTSLTPQQRSKAYWSRANIHRRSGDMQRVLADFTAGAAVDPTSLACGYGHAETLLRLGRFEEAITSAQRLDALVPDYLWILSVSGNAKIQLDRDDAALIDFKKANYHAGHARLLALQGNHDEAIEVLNAGDAKAGRRDDETRIHLLYWAKKYTEADVVVQRTAQMFALAGLGSRLVRAQLLLAQGAADKALAALPKDGVDNSWFSEQEFHTERGLIYLALGKRAEAKADFQRVLTLFDYRYERGRSHAIAKAELAKLG